MVPLLYTPIQDLNSRYGRSSELRTSIVRSTEATRHHESHPIRLEGRPAEQISDLPMSRITYIGTLYELGQLSVRRRLPETTAWVVGGVAHRLNGSVAEVHQLPPQTVLGEHRTQR